MNPFDPERLAQILAQILELQGSRSAVQRDREGWIEVAELRGAATHALGVEVQELHIRAALEGTDGLRVEWVETRLRVSRSRASIRDHRGSSAPDILFHATSGDRAAEFRARGVLTAGDRRPVFLSPDDGIAWRVAHRSAPRDPAVLVVDVARARRHGSRFWRNRRNGLFLSTPVRADDVLNFHDDYAEQVSAGGIPVAYGPDGEPHLALIRVQRRGGGTWEVAKGKLEAGETPEASGIREVREEMGIDAELRITHDLGKIRYGFMAPGGHPRLKVVHMFLMTGEALEDEAFRPAHREGIAEVRWFSPEDAADAVTHPSLIPMMAEVVHILRGTPSSE
jgi:RNA:NAD 2'-phosphotransferase (TPT1/KptA family)/ADP-ribose pyrophosphatase YjhB (NUDIX family)